MKFDHRESGLENPNLSFDMKNYEDGRSVLRKNSRAYDVHVT